MEDSEPKSLFVVAYICNEEPHFSILQLETPKQIKKAIENTSVVAPEKIKNTKVDGRKLLFLKRMDLWLVQWSVSPPTSSTGDFYLLPSFSNIKPLCGYQFNFGTGSFDNIPVPPSMKEGKIESVVNLDGRIYRLALCYSWDYSVFDCYDPETNSWKVLKPSPYVNIGHRVYATAVLSDTILYSVGFWGIVAYDVGGNEWYHVETKDERCCSILGQAVVIQGIIYALSATKDAVLALSIQREEGSGAGGDLVFKCSLRSMILLSFRSHEPDSDEAPSVTSTHLVHLGKAVLCLVEGCEPDFLGGTKHIHVTYMRLPKETEMTGLDLETEMTGLDLETKMTKLADHWFETPDHERTRFSLCFSLPKCNTIALEGSKHLVFQLNPFIHVCYSIYVRDLRANVTFSQLEKGLKVFGSIKRDGIQINRQKKANTFAVVEFERMSSWKRAIKASTVLIGGSPAKISEKSMDFFVEKYTSRPFY